MATIPGASVNFHRLKPMPPHCALIYLTGVEPASARRGTVPMAIGSIYSDAANIQYRVGINAGRLGLKALEISIIITGAAGGDRIEATFAFEPGTAVKSPPGAYQLQVFTATYLGKPGGAGRNYDHDPVPIGNDDLDTHKRTIRMTVMAHGFVTYPDTSTIDKLLNALPATHAARNLVQTLLGATTVNMKVYCKVNAGRQTQIHVEALEPLGIAVASRHAPLPQYTPLKQVLTLDLASYARIGDSMYCQNRNIPINPSQKLPSTQGRREIRPIAIVQMVGFIRENQAREDRLDRFCSVMQQARLVRGTFPIFSSQSRLLTEPAMAVAVPSDMRCYVVYVDCSPNATSSVFVPPAATIFLVKWTEQSNESAYGMVLDSLALAAQSTIAIALFRVPGALKAQAAHSRLSAPSRSVKLAVVRNRYVAQSRLDSMHQFAIPSQKRGVADLQQASVWQPSRTTFGRDLRPNAIAWNSAVDEVKSHLLDNAALSNREDRLLTSLMSDMTTLQLVQVSVSAKAFRSVLGLVPVFLAIDIPVIIVAETPEDRAAICQGVQATMAQGHTAPTHAQKWTNYLPLAYTTRELTHGSGDNVNLRKSINLSTRYLDDFAHHNFITDDSGVHFNANPTSAPNNGIPVNWSMGEAIQVMLGAGPSQPRNQYYFDRYQQINATIPLDSAQSGDMLSRRMNVERRVLRAAKVIITNYCTALSENMTSTKKNPAIIFVGTQEVPFTHIAGVVSRYQHLAAFVCGDLGDSRHPMQLVSLGQNENEAEVTTSRTAWQTLVDAGNVPHVL